MLGVTTRSRPGAPNFCKKNPLVCLKRPKTQENTIFAFNISLARNKLKEQGFIYRKFGKPQLLEGSQSNRNAHFGLIHLYYKMSVPTRAAQNGVEHARKTHFVSTRAQFAEKRSS